MNQAASPALAAPNFEVKLYLDAVATLDVEFKPTRAVENVFNLKNSNRKIAMQFLDDRALTIRAEGWSVRIRKFENDKQFELSCKRRYPIGTGTLTDALIRAGQEGFQATETDYAAQVEWGFDKQTLSFSRRKALEVKGYAEMNLPSLIDSRTGVLHLLPGKLDRWKRAGWARSVIEQCRLFGPVLGKRWTGRWPGPELSLEVWLIKTESGPGYEPVVELSFKESTQPRAAAAREELMKLTRGQHWLLERDVLKTELILNRY